MKLGRWLSRATLSLFLSMFLLGTAALVQAQDQRDDNKPAQPEASKPSQQDEHSNPDKGVKPSKEEDAKPSKQDEKTQDMNNPARSEDKKAGQEDIRPQAGQNGNARESKQPANQHPAAQMQGNANGKRGGHIPDDKFHASFGRQHTFVMQQPTVVQGQPTFQYGGYSFSLVDAWPAGWAYTDQCYIDYIDGEYFLFDLAHPGVRLAIVVVL